MQRRSMFLLILIVFVCVIVGFFVFRKTTLVDDGKIHISTTVYPIAEFARQVGGEFVTVTTLTPPGVEPHEYEPPPQAIASIYQSDLFLYNGGGIDAWATKLVSGMSSIQSLSLREVIPNLLPNTSQNSVSNASQETVVYDEHVWLNPVFAQLQVIAIRDALIGIDSLHAQQYRANAEAFLGELVGLDQDYRKGLSTCSIHSAVTSHAAFGYLAQEYGFTQIAITGLSPDEEPSAGALAEIVQKARDQKVRFIFTETLVSPRLAETLAREVGVQTLSFNPIEGLTEQEQTEGKTYLSLMRENLHHLRIAMSCR